MLRRLPVGFRSGSGLLRRLPVGFRSGSGLLRRLPVGFDPPWLSRAWLLQACCFWQWTLKAHNSRVCCIRSLPPASCLYQYRPVWSCTWTRHTYDRLPRCHRRSTGCTGVSQRCGSRHNAVGTAIALTHFAGLRRPAKAVGNASSALHTYCIEHWALVHNDCLALLDVMFLPLVKL